MSSFCNTFHMKQTFKRQNSTRKAKVQIMKKTKMRNLLLSLAIIASTLICTSTPVMAAEANSVMPIVEGDRGNFANDPMNKRNIPSGYEVIYGETARASGIYGYAAGYTNSTTGSFTINATGSGTSKGGFTIESYSFSSSDVTIGITLKRPDGTVAKTVTLHGNQKIENLSFSNAPAGTYTVVYWISGTSRGWLGGWVYSS